MTGAQLNNIYASMAFEDNSKANDTRFNICWATNVVAAVQQMLTVYHVMLNVEICRSTCWKLLNIVERK